MAPVRRQSEGRAFGPLDQPEGVTRSTRSMVIRSPSIRYMTRYLPTRSRWYLPRWNPSRGYGSAARAATATPTARMPPGLAGNGALIRSPPETTGSSLVAAEQLGHDVFVRSRSGTPCGDPLVVRREGGLDLRLLQGLRRGVPFYRTEPP